MVASKTQTITVAERPKIRSHRSRALMRFWQNKAGVAGAIIVTFMLLFAFGLTLFIRFPSTNILQANKMPFEAAGHQDRQGNGNQYEGRKVIAQRHARSRYLAPDIEHWQNTRGDNARFQLPVPLWSD